MKLEFAAQITAADAETRTLTGMVVPFGKPGNTSAGKVIFEVGSITNLEDPSAIKLLMEHDPTRPAGRWIEFNATPAGIVGKAKVASTTAGNDLLVEAADGLRDGFSVGVRVNAHDVKKGVIHVLDATLEEISAVANPAFDDARIVDVAASEPDEADVSTDKEPEMTENVTPVEEATTVEASAAPTVQAAAPIYTRVRHGIQTPGNFVEHSLKAHLGDAQSREWIQAASDGTTTEWAGLIPTPQLGQVFNGKTTGVRPAVEAVSRGTLPAYGKTFELPRVKTAPTAAVAAEGGAFSDTQAEVEYLSVDVKKIAGMQLADVEVIYRSTPAYFDELARLMADAFAGAQDGLVTASLIANGTADGTAITLPWDGDEIAGFISRAAASVYAGSKRFPTGVIMTADQWAALMAVNDTTKRPLFNLNGDSVNGMGTLDPSAPVGRIMGLPVYVDPHLATTTADGSILVVNSDAYTFYEGPRAELRVDTVSTGKISIGYYSFAAVAPKAAAGCFKFNAA